MGNLIMQACTTRNGRPIGAVPEHGQQVFAITADDVRGLSGGEGIAGEFDDGRDDGEAGVWVNNEYFYKWEWLAVWWAVPELVKLEALF